jgi:hypothetical protein
MKLLSLVILLSVSGITLAEELDYQLENGVFKTSHGVIPSGCFGQLIAELNGDDTVAAIYLNRTAFRGCTEANMPYPGGAEKDISYDVKQSLGKDIFNITVRQKLQGSMKYFDSNITVQFTNKSFLLKDKSKKLVLSLEKLGEW